MTIRSIIIRSPRQLESLDFCRWSSEEKVCCLLALPERIHGATALLCCERNRSLLISRSMLGMHKVPTLCIQLLSGLDAREVRTDQVGFNIPVNVPRLRRRKGATSEEGLEATCCSLLIKRRVSQFHYNMSSGFSLGTTSFTLVVSKVWND